MSEYVAVNASEVSVKVTVRARERRPVGSLRNCELATAVLTVTLIITLGIDPTLALSRLTGKPEV